MTSSEAPKVSGMDACPKCARLERERDELRADVVRARRMVDSDHETLFTRCEALEKALADALGQWEWFEREGPYTGRQALWLKWMKRVDALLHQREEDE